MSDTSTLAAALVKARGEIRSPKKTSQNPHFHSDYAPLDEIVAVSAGPLAANGLAIVQAPRLNVAGQMVLNTTVWHASGQSLDCGDFLLAVQKPGSQEMGSAITYARRYAMAAVLNIAAEDDDDGNASEETDVAERVREVFHPAPRDEITERIYETPSVPSLPARVEPRRKVTTAPPVASGVTVGRLTELGRVVATLGIFTDAMSLNEKKAAVYAWSGRKLSRDVRDWSQLSSDEVYLLEAAAAAGEK